jgi:hypothetical protein
VRRNRAERPAPAASLKAPMPGTVLQVRVVNDAEVTEGDVPLVLESMKMELTIPPQRRRHRRSRPQARGPRRARPTACDGEGGGQGNDRHLGGLPQCAPGVGPS